MVGERWGFSLSDNEPFLVELCSGEGRGGENFDCAPLCLSGGAVGEEPSLDD